MSIVQDIKTGNKRLDLIAFVDALNMEERGRLLTSMCFEARKDVRPIFKEDRPPEFETIPNPRFDSFYLLLALVRGEFQIGSFEVKK